MNKISSKLVILLSISLLTMPIALGQEADDYGIISVEQVQQEDLVPENISEEDNNMNSDEVDLDVSNIKSENISNDGNQKALNTPEGYSEEYNKQAHNQNLYDTDRAYRKEKTSYKKSKKFKHSEIGAQYDTTFTPDSASQTRTLYSKYNLNDKASVNASYSNNSLAAPSQQMKGTVSIAPEYRFNKNLSVVNKYSKNMGSGSTKEEVSVKINPFKDTERMDFTAGAGQVQYTSGAPSSSQINFGTNIRF